MSTELTENDVCILKNLLMEKDVSMIIRQYSITPLDTILQSIYELTLHMHKKKNQERTKMYCDDIFMNNFGINSIYIKAITMSDKLMRFGYDLKNKKLDVSSCKHAPYKLDDVMWCCIQCVNNPIEFDTNVTNINFKKKQLDFLWNLLNQFQISNFEITLESKHTHVAIPKKYLRHDHQLSPNLLILKSYLPNDIFYRQKLIDFFPQNMHDNISFDFLGTESGGSEAFISCKIKNIRNY
jgi:hypothetical protein